MFVDSILSHVEFGRNDQILNSIRDNFVKHCNSDPDETGRKRRADGDTKIVDDEPEVKPEIKPETTPIEDDYCSFNKNVSKCTIRNTCIYHYNFSMQWNFGDTGTFINQKNLFISRTVTRFLTLHGGSLN